jgi:hypothetical protein
MSTEAGTDTIKVVSHGVAPTLKYLLRVSTDSMWRYPLRDSTGIGLRWAADSALVLYSTGFANGGNSFGGTATLGTNDENALQFETNGTSRFTLTAAGTLHDGTSPPAGFSTTSSGTALSDTLWATGSLALKTGSFTGFNMSSNDVQFKFGNAIVFTFGDKGSSGGSYLRVSRGASSTSTAVNFYDANAIMNPGSSSTAVVSQFYAVHGYATAADSATYFSRLNGYYHAFNAADLFITNTATPAGYQPFTNARGFNHFNTTSGQSGFGLPNATATTSMVDIDPGSGNGYKGLRLRRSYTPTATGDTNGNTGDVTWDDSYIYIKTSAGWKRSALSTF